MNYDAAGPREPLYCIHSLSFIMLNFWKENPGYWVTMTIHHLDVKIKIEWRKDKYVARGQRGYYKDPKDKCSNGDNPPITALTSPCGDNNIIHVGTILKGLRNIIDRVETILKGYMQHIAQ